MSLQMSTKYNYRVIGCGFFSGMALLSFKADGDEVDIVCGALCAKFQTENLSSGFTATFPLVEGVSHLSNLSIMLLQKLEIIYSL